MDPIRKEKRDKIRANWECARHGRRVKGKGRKGRRVGKMYSLTKTIIKKKEKKSTQKSIPSENVLLK